MFSGIQLDALHRNRLLDHPQHGFYEWRVRTHDVQDSPHGRMRIRDLVAHALSEPIHDQGLLDRSSIQRGRWRPPVRENLTRSLASVFGKTG